MKFNIIFLKKSVYYKINEFQQFEEKKISKFFLTTNENITPFKLTNVFHSFNCLACVFHFFNFFPLTFHCLSLCPYFCCIQLVKSIKCNSHTHFYNSTRGVPALRAGCLYICVVYNFILC